MGGLIMEQALIEKCIHKMIEDQNIPRGSKLTKGHRWKGGEKIEGCDYIRISHNEVIPFEHRNNPDFLNAIMKGNYRIGQSSIKDDRRVVEVQIGGDWVKLEVESDVRDDTKWKKVK